MTFDEFLVSKEISNQFGDDHVLKVKYNNNIDYIFKTNYGGLNFNSELKCAGLFHKTDNKLYGSRYDFTGVFNKNMYSNFYVGTIEGIKNSLYNNADKLLNTYINENSKTLKEMAKNIFDKFISYEGNYEEIKELAVKNYIYQSDDNELEFHVNTSKYESTKNLNDITMEYLEFPEETEYKVFKEYLNNEEKTERIYSREGSNIDLTVKERIGVRLLEQDLKNKLVDELNNDPTNKYKLKHDIVESIKDIDAQMLTINLCHNGKEIDFKYPKDQLYNFWLSYYHISEVSKRNEIKDMYKNERGYDDFHLEDIKSISYRKQILYENNKEMELNNENEIEQNSKNIYESNVKNNNDFDYDFI